MHVVIGNINGWGGGCRTNELSKMVKGLCPPHLPGETRGKLDPVLATRAYCMLTEAFVMREKRE